MKIICIAILLAGSIHAVAQTQAADSSASTTESIAQRSKMADLHQKMATCLRSSKSLMDCQEEMRSTCEMEMGKGSCMMPGHMMGNKGMMNKQRAMEMKKTEKTESRE